MKQRIIGYDLARALAILGMIFVNFRLVMAHDADHPRVLFVLMEALQGRAAATFVVLAGVGISLLTRDAWQERHPEVIQAKRRMLLKRAVFLFAVGLVNLLIWPADILHFYGVYFALCAWLIAVDGKWLWRLALAGMVGFFGLLLTLNYEQGWNFDTFEYHDLWTAEGFIRHLFYNGFHPVLPWVGFALIGMWLGRQDMTQSHLIRRLLLTGLVLALSTEILSALLTAWARTASDNPDFESLFWTKPLPPQPIYFLSALGTAFVVIALCLLIGQRYAHLPIIQALVAAGQIALTLYIAHVILGMGILDTFGVLENRSLGFVVGYSLVFFAVSVWFAEKWKKSYRHGPLEWVMRRVTE